MIRVQTPTTQTMLKRKGGHVVSFGQRTQSVLVKHVVRKTILQIKLLITNSEGLHFYLRKLKMQSVTLMTRVIGKPPKGVGMRLGNNLVGGNTQGCVEQLMR